MNETCSLDTSCDHLLQLDSPSLLSELQDNSIVENTETESVPDFEDLLQLDSNSVSSQDTSSIEFEFVSESEGQLDNANLSPRDISVSTMTDRIPSTTPGADPPRDARDSGSARLHSMHLETSSSDRP